MKTRILAKEFLLTLPKERIIEHILIAREEEQDVKEFLETCVDKHKLIVDSYQCKPALAIW